ncbi:hypothetical protein [Leptolyngbya sp. FACHB-16]|uniref:hypothetical protein n=1 Tax=unclassified Leptolyngbya TaxID=2650499 RepID=UPI00168A3E81|nr:hypothetical protein [Leptolyngbya sp. FACHB-16]MBD2158429.1 hypothetical protein [Leptolyngbya sp. FACHB-16]
MGWMNPDRFLWLIFQLMTAKSSIYPYELRSDRPFSPISTAIQPLTFYWCQLFVI